ncbi:MAG TPA: DUF4350 domain-containing protein [Flavobacterium sp.]|jgi:hypothetical protein
MNSRLYLYIGLIVLLLGVMTAMDMSKPKEIDWTPTYEVSGKIPFGLHVFNREAESLLKRKVNRVNVSPYEYLESTYDYDTEVQEYSVSGTLMAISQVNYLDESSVDELFYFAGHGNTVFLSMKTFPGRILDSLKLDMSSDLTLSDSIPNWMSDQERSSKKYYIKEEGSPTYFSEIDSASTTILGYQGTDSIRSNFVKVRFHEGFFLLHTQPGFFTNFHLLKGTHHEYVENVLSHLPQNEVHWFVDDPRTENSSSSHLRYILSQPALKWAWLLFLGGMLFFMFFNAKRRQRVVPVIKPLENTTVDFAKTIGNLYYQEGDHDTIIDKKIIYFLERIRSEYMIDTSNLNEDFVRKLHQKSGKDILAIERAVFLINMHRKSPHSSVEGDLIQINHAIEKIIH